MSNQYKKMPPQQLSEGDKNAYAPAQPPYREAYPEHPAVVLWNKTRDLEVSNTLRQEASDKLVQAAKTKLASNYMNKAIQTYTDSMEEYSQLSIETAIELVQNARSEKVRADLAIEGIRHKIGTPIQKIAVQEQRTVHITFGKPADNQ